MDRRVIYLKRQIASNLRTKFTVKQMAKMIEVSPTRLEEIFKADVGKTPTEYLKDERMKKAVELLETTFKDIKEICYETGIGDQRNFSREFKKRFGQTPTEYRNGLKENDDGGN
jgi:transcriptional regulator GlxA family with amidase domain